MKTKTTRNWKWAAALILLLATVPATTASASTITVNFTAAGGFSGVFLYDDAAALAVPAGTPYFQGGTSYVATSFTVNGIAQAGPFYVELYDNFMATTTDYIYFTGPAATGPLLQLVGTGAITGTGLAQLTGKTLASFNDVTGLNDFYAGAYTGANGANSADLTSLSITAVPEPATMTLVGLGVAGMVRRRFRLNAPR